jgi:hypothetical protein
MTAVFKSAALQALYDGTAPNSEESAAANLAKFRTGGDTILDALDTDIESLDKRIATFESALISTLSSGKSSSEYPYDREGLRREFLDEVLALLLRRSHQGTGNYAANSTLISADGGTITVSGAPIPNPSFRGGTQTVVAKDATTGFGNFDNLDTTDINSDPRLLLLKIEGRQIFKAYASLIDAVFAEGDKLGNNPAQSVQMVSAIQPITINGVVYDRVAQVSGTTTVDNPPKTIPTFESYLLEATAVESRVIKDVSGDVGLSGPLGTVAFPGQIPPNTDSSTAKRLQLNPEPATRDTATDKHIVTVDGLAFSITVTKEQIVVQTGTPPVPAAIERIPPLALNIAGRGHLFPEERIVANHRIRASNGSDYLIGLGSDGKVYVTSLADTRRSELGPVASLSGLEYLLFYNEARIRILRAQLAYKEAIVREIQDDLKQANAALAELERQNGAVTATKADGTKTGQFSAETLQLNLFNATNSTAGKPFLNTTENDAYHNSEEWTQNRVSLKNYIDRRSAEAQEATLDYQTVLNRFNNAFEVMAKLQEKLDTLLKAQIRNFG